MQRLRHLRFKLRSAILLILFIAMFVAMMSQFQRIAELQNQVRQLRANIESPTATVRAISFIEVVQDKESGERYMNKVFIAEDGRKLVESLTSKRGLVSIFDDFGIQRLLLRPSKKSATVFEAVEEVGGGQDLNTWLSNFQRLVENPEDDLGRKEMNGKTARGFLSKQNGDTYTVWVKDATGEPLQVEVDDTHRTTAMYDIQYYDTLDEAMFSFDAPDDYAVVEHHQLSKP